jgi:tRNA-specific 2-thiouridylase
MVDHESGRDLGPVDAVELVTVGQRRGMGHGADGRRRYVTAVDVRSRTVAVGTPEAACTASVLLHTITWVDGDPTREAGNGAHLKGSVPAIAQCSAHGLPLASTLVRQRAGLSVEFAERQRRVAPGQTVALYDPDDPDTVVGSGIAA